MKPSSKWLLGTVVAAGVLGASITAFAATTTTSAQNSTNSVQRLRGHIGCGPGFVDLSSAATAIGISQATLQSDLQAGQSIASVAQSKGVSEQTVISALEKSFQAQLATAVSNGKLTVTQEQQMTTNFDNHVKQMVEHKGGMGPGHGGPGGPLGRRHARFDLSAAATAIGISQATLQSDLQAGQSIASVAQSKGVSEQTVITAIEKSFQAQLATAVSNGKLTTAQEQQMTTNFDNHVKQMVEHKGGMGPGPGGPGRHFGGK